MKREVQCGIGVSGFAVFVGVGAWVEQHDKQ